MSYPQRNFSLNASDEARLRYLAGKTYRNVRSLTIFALLHTDRSIKAAPVETIEELARLVNHRVGDRTQINFAMPADVQELLDEIRATIEETNGFAFTEPGLLRASCALWLATHSDSQLIADLGEPYRRTA